jgi:hypothetical protein
VAQGGGMTYSLEGILVLILIVVLIVFVIKRI